MATRQRKAPASTRKFGVLRFIAYFHVFIGLIVFIGGIVAAALTFGSASSPVVVGDQVVTLGGATAAVGVFISALVVALIYVGIGHAILAFLSIEEHSRRSALAQEKLLRANLQLIQQLDQRLP